MKNLPNLSPSEFLTLLSGTNNKTCPESEYFCVDITKFSDCFVNGIGFIDSCAPFNKLTSIDEIQKYIEELENDSSNSNKSYFDVTDELLKRYIPIIILKILPYGERTKNVEVLPIDIYYEYMGSCNESEANNMQRNLIKRYITE